jgi:hypothetical protein
VARMGEGRKVYKVLVRNPEGKRPLGKPSRKRENGIRMTVRHSSIRWASPNHSVLIASIILRTSHNIQGIKNTVNSCRLTSNENCSGQWRRESLLLADRGTSHMSEWWK